MASRFTLHEGYQDHHLAPEAIMNSHPLFMDLGALWDRNNLNYNIIPLPTNDTFALDSGIARHSNTSHPGYSSWYQDQLDIILAEGGSAETKMAKVIGLNNVVKKALTDPNIEVSLHSVVQTDDFGNTLNSKEAWTAALDYDDYSQTAEFQLGLKGGGLPSRDSRRLHPQPPRRGQKRRGCRLRGVTASQRPITEKPSNHWNCASQMKPRGSID